MIVVRRVKSPHQKSTSGLVALAVHYSALRSTARIADTSSLAVSARLARQSRGRSDMKVRRSRRALLLVSAAFVLLGAMASLTAAAPIYTAWSTPVNVGS